MERPVQRPGINFLQEKLRELQNTRKALNEYVAILNAPHGSFGATVHDVLWADRRNRADGGQGTRHLDDLKIEGCLRLTTTEIDRRKSALGRFERAAVPLLERCGRIADHPWFGANRAGLPTTEIDDALRALADAAEAMEDVRDRAAALSDFGVDAVGSVTAIKRASSSLASLPVTADVPGRLYAGMAGEDVRAAMRDWLPLCRRYRAAIVAVRQHGVGEPASDWEQMAAQVGQGILLLAGTSADTIDGIDAWASGLEADAARLREAVARAGRVASLMGCGAPATFEDMRLLALASALACSLDDFMIAAMSPALVRRGSAELVQAVASEIDALRQRAGHLEIAYRIHPAPRADVLREAAATLRGAGPLSFLSKAVKGAGMAHAALARSPAKASRAEMVEALDAVAGHVAAVEAFRSNAAHAELLGRRFNGVDTNLDAASTITAWAARVRAEIPGASELGRSLRAVLLCGDTDRLEALSGALSAVPYEEWDGPTPGPEGPSSPADAAVDMERRASTSKAFAADWIARGLDPAARIEDLNGLADALRRAAEAEAEAEVPPVVRSALGSDAPSPSGEMAGCEAALAAASAVAAAPLPADVRRRLLAMPPETLAATVIAGAASLLEASSTMEGRTGHAKGMLGLDEAFFGGVLADVPIAAAVVRARRATDGADAFGGWLGYRIERQEAERLGLGGILALWDRGLLAAALPDAFGYALYRSLAREAFAAHPALERHTGLGQEDARRRFRSLDAETTGLRRMELVERLSGKSAPWGNGVGNKGDYTDGALLAHEASKLKRHLPIRQLMDRAGNAVQALKPCFMMSPMSVAQYLKPGGLHFDLLVIDEASQMRPEDALGAIARSAQIIVVGDPKQLPPTAFFAGADDEAGDDDGAADTVDAKSILDLAQATFRPMRRLRWHYRSRHGSLIAFSNHEFYDDDLIVFPSPAETNSDQGVSLTKVDGTYASRSNIAEVEAVCDAAVGHMRRHPGRSLGIATMNGVQRDLIAQRMDQLASGDAEVEAYVQEWAGTLERFFVKNLENVQGDERDTILVSTVFGPPTSGGRVRQTFGPINGASGHRRLNVLFTRAKHHLRVFTSMTPDDIVAGPDSPRGARVLKAYLAYAAGGRLHAGEESDRAVDSDFEVFVRERLRNAGYEAVPQVGVAGFFIDLAVRDPDVPGTFLLGIECDGASYHSSRSARDRDILRQQVLEGLGWTIFRIWSTDWFRDPAGQTRRMTEFINRLRTERRNARAQPAGA